MDFSNNRITITILGDGGCGKSSITLRLVRSQWTSDYDPTIEDSYSITRRVDGQTYHLSLTDTAGQEEYRGLATGNMKSDAFLLVYDITNPTSLEVLEEFNALIDQEAEARIDRLEATWSDRRRGGGGRGKSSTPTSNIDTTNICTMPIKIVAGNKCDLSESRSVTSKTGLEWARKRGCGFMETSARNMVNIEETFALIVRRVVEARKMAMVDAGVVEPGGARQGIGTAGSGRGSAGGIVGHHGFVTGQGQHSATSRGMTAPLSPLPAEVEKASGRSLRNGGGRSTTGFWSRLRCW